MTVARRLRSSVGSVVTGALVLSGVGAAVLAGSAPAFADDPVAGGQTASPADTLFPNQGNSGYDVSHYDVNFRVDVTVATASGAVGTTNLPNATATIQAATTGAPLSSYSFDFQGSTGNLAASTLNVDSVTVNGVAATFSRIENTTTSNATTDVHKLIVTPATPVSGAFTTVVNYHGAPVRHTDTDGSAEGWNNTTDGATFLNQPVGAMTLFPNNNTPRDKATYTFTVDAPSMLQTSNYAHAGGKPYQAGVVSNGELVSRTVSGDRTTWVWNEAKPMASELSMVSVGRYDIYESDIHLDLSNRDIHEWTFIDPAISVANQTTTLRSRTLFKPLLDFYEAKYGPYPGNSTGVVTDVVPSAINYALETQDRPFFPNSASGGTFYHEVMHQWWGDSVAPTDWNDIVLNEGPATYAETQVPYESAGSSTTSTETSIYNAFASSSTTSSVWSVPSAAMTQASQLFGSHVYTRGNYSLEALRTAIGAGNFETLMRNYQATYGGGQITGRRTAAFQALAESISGRDLTAFFNTWWYTTGKPTWPFKFNLNLAGPTTQVNQGDQANYTITVRNTGKVAMAGGATTINLDATDILDDATVGTLPAGVTQSGNTLAWSVPATATGATSSVTIPFTANNASAKKRLRSGKVVRLARRGNGTLVGSVRATTLGSTCLDCTSTTALGTPPVSPAPAPTVTPGTAPVVGTLLTADTSGWPAGTTFTYQWLIDGTPVPGATRSQYTPTGDVVGLGVAVKVTGSLAGANPVTQTSAATPAGVRATPASSTPTISGTPKIGVPLTVSPGTWEPGTYFSYQWLANGVNISGATGPTYTPAVSTQAGQAITVTVTGTKFGYTTTSRTSAPTAAVAAGDPLTSTPTPVFTSTPKVGVVIAPNYGSWDDGVTTTFQWAANGTAISGATSGSYTPTGAQAGQTLTVTVTGTKPGITAVARTSAPSAAVEPGTQTLQPTPSITGTPTPNVASTGVPGTWDTGTTLSYKWYVDGVVIPGANTTTYTPTTAQNGQVLTFEVTSTRTGYTTVTKTSPGKTIVGVITNQSAPSISGTPSVGSELTADPGTWTPGSLDYAYQWFANGVPIAGATQRTFTPTAAQDGKLVAVRVTASRPEFTSVSASSRSVRVAGAPISNDTAPQITGSPTVGSTLSLSNGSWNYNDLTFTYQWYANGNAIRGASQSTYTIPASMAGKTITGKVTASRPGSDAVTATSSNSVTPS